MFIAEIHNDYTHELGKRSVTLNKNKVMSKCWPILNVFRSGWRAESQWKENSRIVNNKKNQNETEEKKN